MERGQGTQQKKKKIENKEEGEKKTRCALGAAKTTVAGSIIDDFCIIQANIT